MLHVIRLRLMVRAPRIRIQGTLFRWSVQSSVDNNKNLETIIYNNPILSDCPLQNTECFELGCCSKSRLRSWSATSYSKEFWASSRWLRQLSLSMRSPQLIAATLSSFCWHLLRRLTEEILHESIDARTEVLAALRELGPPDLVQLIKQAPRNPGKQVCQATIILLGHTYWLKVQIGVYHHVTGVDASSSASLAAYINTLTYKESHQSPTKIVEGVYWYDACNEYSWNSIDKWQLLQRFLTTRYARSCNDPWNRW